MSISEITKRRSFNKIWRTLGTDDKNKVIDIFLNNGYAISTFYNDKRGLSPITDERMEVYIKAFSAIGVENIWD